MSSPGNVCTCASLACRLGLNQTRIPTAMIASPDKATSSTAVDATLPEVDEMLPEEASLFTPKIGPPDVTYRCNTSSFTLCKVAR